MVRMNVNKEWLVAMIKELFAVVGVSIIGREPIVLEFLSYSI